MALFAHVPFEDLPIDVVAIRAVTRPEVLFDGDQRPRGHMLTVSCQARKGTWVIAQLRQHLLQSRFPPKVVAPDLNFDGISVLNPEGFAKADPTHQLKMILTVAVAGYRFVYV